MSAAEDTQLAHAADEDGWCRFHLRHYGLRIPAGQCAPFLMAAQDIRDRRQARQIRVEYTRPPARPGRVGD